MGSVAPLFISNHYQALFSQHQLADFDAIWRSEIVWFEPPNKRRGGFSGVGSIMLKEHAPQANNHGVQRFFVKKQQNHGRKSWKHPIAGEPTFRREFNNLIFLQQHNIGAPKVVYYAENISAKQAILITENLTDFVPMDTIDLAHLNQTQQYNLVQKAALEVKRLHHAGLVHRALYPKHIFVKNAQSTENSAPEIAFIDLEKARFSPLAWYRAYFDLAAFTRHATSWNNENKDLFINTYFAKQRLNFFDKLLCMCIARRAKR